MNALFLVTAAFALVSAQEWPYHLVMVDISKGTPGKVIVLPEDRQATDPKIVVDPANRVIASRTAEQLLSTTQSGFVSDVKIGVVNGNDLANGYPTRWIGLSVARRELRDCKAQPAEDLGTENSRDYFLVRLNCSRPLAGWNHVYLGIGVQGGDAKIIYLNEGAPIGAIPARNKNG